MKNAKYTFYRLEIILYNDEPKFFFTLSKIQTNECSNIFKLKLNWPNVCTEIYISWSLLETSMDSLVSQYRHFIQVPSIA